MDTLLPADVGAPPSWRFACPICRQALALGSRDAHCVRCGRVYARSSGIWRFLPDERLARYERFLREYRIVREDQGWGRPDAAYFLALPQAAPDDPQRDIWRRRDESYRLLCAKIIDPLAARRGRPLRILDLGAGNCWLAYRLTERGHQVAAIDLSVDPTDGLGAHVWYRPELERAGCASFWPIQAEYDRLPLPDCSADVALFNASLHYSTDCSVTLREALRVLSPEGIVVIMDTRSTGGPVAGNRWCASARWPSSAPTASGPTASRRSTFSPRIAWPGWPTAWGCSGRCMLVPAA